MFDRNAVDHLECDHMTINLQGQGQSSASESGVPAKVSRVSTDHVLELKNRYVREFSER